MSAAVKKKKPKKIQTDEIEISDGPVVQKIGFVRRTTTTARCDVDSHELVTMIKDSLTGSLETIYFGMHDAAMIADEVSRDVLRNLKYGVPTPTLFKPVSIREADYDDPPLCKECEDDEPS